MFIYRINKVAQALPIDKRQTVLSQLIKRTIDVFFSLLALIILLPILLLITACIKLTDFSSPVIFVQERIGIDGKNFNMYKFRSMCPDAEDKLQLLLDKNEADGAMFKIKDDPRVTPIGRVLRNYSLDELPQFYNVLRGDMSLIGPRPCLYRELQNYTEHDKLRLKVKPGITGLWQVSGRSGLSFEQMIELDLAYIKTMSVKNDLKILFKTMIVVFKSENAY